MYIFRSQCLFPANFISFWHKAVLLEKQSNINFVKNNVKASLANTAKTVLHLNQKKLQVFVLINLL